MTTVVVLFNLKPGVDAARYEAWARERDVPNVNALESVSDFRVLRAQGLLNGAPAPFQYVELIEIGSTGAFRAEVKSQAMQSVAREFREFADSPLFIVTEPL
jgi:hypothetical protein